MKLSWKFFCIAYAVTLLSTGIGSGLLIRRTLNMAWESLEERVRTSEYYAVNSFASYARTTKGNLSEKELLAVCKQINGIIDANIDELEILSEDQLSYEKYGDISINQGYDQFIQNEDQLMMEVVYKIEIDKKEYIIRVTEDFSKLQEERERIWFNYCKTVLGVALISGSLLYILAGKITKPLYELKETSNAIALGDYGKLVKIDTSTEEIAGLAESFNAMSEAIQKALNETRLEYKKRDRFVADFTHEMKTPMTSIIGYSDMLKSYELSEIERNKAAESIYTEAIRLEHLSHQMLELLVLQKEEISKEKISLLNLKKHLEEHLRFVSEKYEVGFEIYFLDVCIYANWTLLLSLLYNLADNAFKASEKGAFIEIYTLPSDGLLTFCVQDKGHGIGEIHLEHLTEEFYREDKARSRKQGGAGLGLSICKEIARQHETSLVFESREGEGTKVSFSLKKAGDYYA